MSVLVKGEIVLFGPVGEPDGGFTDFDIVEALAQVGRTKPLNVRINSGGGSAFEGVAIYNALAAHKGKVTTIVEGIAASAASIIAMAGSEIVMRSGAVMMIHDPSMQTIGTADTHRQTVAALDTVAESMAEIYAGRTGRTVAECRAEMRAETWLSADAAVARRYATKADSQKAAPIAAFDYGKYRKTPLMVAACGTPSPTKHAAVKQFFDDMQTVSQMCEAAGVPDLMQQIYQAGAMTPGQAQLHITAELAAQRFKHRSTLH